MRQHIAKGNKTSYFIVSFQNIWWLYLVMSSVSLHVCTSDVATRLAIVLKSFVWNFEAITAPESFSKHLQRFFLRPQHWQGMCLVPVFVDFLAGFNRSFRRVVTSFVGYLASFSSLLLLLDSILPTCNVCFIQRLVFVERILSLFFHLFALECIGWQFFEDVVAESWLHATTGCTTLPSGSFLILEGIVAMVHMHEAIPVMSWAKYSPIPAMSWTSQNKTQEGS